MCCNLDAYNAHRCWLLIISLFYTSATHKCDYVKSKRISETSAWRWGQNAQGRDHLKECWKLDPHAHLLMAFGGVAFGRSWGWMMSQEWRPNNGMSGL